MWSYFNPFLFFGFRSLKSLNKLKRKIVSPFSYIFLRPEIILVMILPILRIKLCPRSETHTQRDWERVSRMVLPPQQLPSSLLAHDPIPNCPLYSFSPNSNCVNNGFEFVGKIPYTRREPSLVNDSSPPPPLRYQGFTFPGFSYLQSTSVWKQMILLLT